MRGLLLACLMFPATAFAGDISFTNPMVPMAPPGAKVHAAYVTISNNGPTTRQLVGVKAEGYAMAHLHLSQEIDGIMTMSAVDLVEIEPGHSVVFERGGLHVMLMSPATPLKTGASVSITFEFADGATEVVAAKVMQNHSHKHHNHGS